MPGWVWWLIGAAWVAAAVLTGLLVGAVVRLRDHRTPDGGGVR